MAVQCTIACGMYDRTAALQSGQVRAEGLDLTYLCLAVEETFWRQLRYQEFDAAEMSLSSYLMAKDRGTPDLVAIPVFPSRFFRHSCVFINRDSGIKEPKDLVGKRVGVPEYQMTAALWIRGILQDEYGVRPADCHWFTGGAEAPGREEKLPLKVAGVTIERIGPEQTLSRMLLDGEIDAMVSARIPSSLSHPSGRVGRIFGDYQATEEAYYSQTGIFPIMHTVVMTRSFYDRYPWAARSLYKAFSEAKRLAADNLRQTAALGAMYPWLVSGIERTVEVMGPDWWPYGIDANRKTLETAVRYSVEQGLIGRSLSLEELFAPNTFQEFVI